MNSGFSLIAIQHDRDRVHVLRNGSIYHFKICQNSVIPNYRPTAATV